MPFNDRISTQNEEAFDSGPGVAKQPQSAWNVMAKYSSMGNSSLIGGFFGEVIGAPRSATSKDCSTMKPLAHFCGRFAEQSVGIIGGGSQPGKYW